MLSHIRLVNFKSFINEHVFLKRLTFLIGPTAGGKTNLLDSLMFLQGLASGMTIAEIVNGRRVGHQMSWPGIRGGASELTWIRGAPFTVGTTWQLAGLWFNHKTTCQLEPIPLVEREFLQRTDQGAYLFDTEAPALRGDTGLRDGTILKVAMKRDGRGPNPTAKYPGTSSLLTQLVHREPMHPAVLEGATRVREAFSGCYFLRVDPAVLRSFEPKYVDSVGPNGEGTSAVLRLLVRDEKFKSWLVEWLSQATATELKDIDFVETGLGGVMIRLIETTDVAVSAAVLSDGVLRLLALVAALLTVPRNSLLLIDELGAGLPPPGIELLVQLFEEMVTERKIQVIATSGSPLVMLTMSELTLGNTVVIGRHPSSGGTVMRRLKDLDRWSDLKERRRLSDLFAPDCVARVT